MQVYLEDAGEKHPPAEHFQVVTKKDQLRLDLSSEMAEYVNSSSLRKILMIYFCVKTQFPPMCNAQKIWTTILLKSIGRRVNIRPLLLITSMRSCKYAILWVWAR